MKADDKTWNIIEKNIINNPVARTSVNNSSRKYEQLKEKARTVKISKTLVIGGWLNSIVLINK